MESTHASFLASSPPTSHSTQWVGRPHVVGPAMLKLPLLTLGVLGLQVVWSVEMAFASPYLISLGLSKSGMAIVFVAGPLSGLVVQPLIGIYADRSRSRYGRRRPFMLAGCAICSVAMLMLGFTAEIAGLFVSRATQAHTSLTIALAVVAIYLIDFSVNAVMAVDRALLVDTLPSDQQELGNAWASRMVGIGSVLGFFIGNIDLPFWLPFLGNTQLKVISLLTAFTLLSTHAVTAWCVSERVLIRDNSPATSPFAALALLWRTARGLPRPIVQICRIQFFAWIAWFPILFYSTVWIGEIYTRSRKDHPPPNQRANEDATRVGSRAMFFQAAISLLTSVVLPPMLARASTAASSNPASRRLLSIIWHHMAVYQSLDFLWAASHFLFAAAMGTAFLAAKADSVGGATAVIALLGVANALEHWAPFSLLGEMILSFSSSSSRNRRRSGSRSLNSTRDPEEDEAGALLMRETRLSTTQRRDAAVESQAYAPSRGRSSSHTSVVVAPDPSAPPESDIDFGRSRASSFAPKRATSPMLVVRHSGEEEVDTSNFAIPSEDEAVEAAGLAFGHEGVGGEDMAAEAERDDDDDDEWERELAGDDDTADKAGVILIHNIAIVIPQFIITFIASLIFAIFEPSRAAIPHANVPPPPPAAVSASSGSPRASSGRSQADALAAAAVDWKRASIQLAWQVEVARAATDVGDDGKGGGGNGITIVLLVGGASAFVAGLLTLTMWREQRWRRMR